MGFNTVMVVLNDNIDIGARDPQLGERIQNAVRSWPARDRRRSDLDIFARSDRCSASYGEIISQAHADYSQVVVVRGNTGRPLPECNDLDWLALDQMKAALERHGYRVTKSRKSNSQTGRDRV